MKIIIINLVIVVIKNNLFFFCFYCSCVDKEELFINLHENIIKKASPRFSSSSEKANLGNKFYKTSWNFKKFLFKGKLFYQIFCYYIDIKIY